MDNKNQGHVTPPAIEPQKKKPGIFGKIGALWKSGVKGKIICIVCVLVIWGIIGAFVDDEEGGAGGKGKTKTITLPGGMKMEMVWCPPGTFLMGSPAPDEFYGRGGEPGRDRDEVQHRVTLTKGFWMAKTEVTQAQWISVMGKNPSSHKGENFPVERVSWNDCMEFCRKTGLQLPTEAEWEYACRAGSTGPFAGTGKLKNMGWYYGNSGEKTKTAHIVAQKKPNAWGLYDMHGNVEEWCADRYGDYPRGAVTDPTGAGSGDYRVLRGGSCDKYGDDGSFCRSASRSGGDPGLCFDNRGFRPVARQN